MSDIDDERPDDVPSHPLGELSRDEPVDHPVDEQPPMSPQALPERQPEGVPSASTRILSSLIDAFVVGVVFLVASAAVTSTMHPVSPGKYSDSQLRWLVLFSVLFALVMATLFAYVQSRGLPTVGKRVTHLHLVGPDGRPASFGRLLLKYVIIFLIFGLLGPLGLIVVLVGVLSASLQQQRRTMFDQLSGLRPVLDH